MELPGAKHSFLPQRNHCTANEKTPKPQVSAQVSARAVHLHQTTACCATQLNDESPLLPRTLSFLSTLRCYSEPVLKQEGHNASSHPDMCSAITSKHAQLLCQLEWSKCYCFSISGKMLLKDYLFLTPFSYKASHKNVTACYHIVFKNMVFTQFLHPVLVTWRLTSYPR